MKEPSESSSSSDSYHVLAKSDLLYWKANGTTNLIKWMPMFLQAVKGKFPLQLFKLPKFCLICCCFSEYSLHSPHDSRLADHALAVYLSGTKSHSFVIN